jgi:alpha-galactosidase
MQNASTFRTPNRRRTLALRLFVTAALYGQMGRTVAEGATAYRVLDDQAVRYTTGLVVCEEALSDGKWVRRYWAADGRPSLAAWQFTDSAFQLSTVISPAASPVELNTGWQTAKIEQLSPDDREQLHVAVTLKKAEPSVQVRVDTMLDDTPIIVRRLEVTNTSDRPLAIHQVCPLAGRLWPRVHHFTLGRQTRSDALYEGWFTWQSLPAGNTTFASDLGNGQDDPFFIVRDDVRGEYFICHFAWSANWSVTFTNVDDPSSPEAGLSVRIEPTAKDELRVLEPAETVRTPAVHLGLVAGTLDDAVQAMHDHIRASVQPPKPPVANLIQLAIPGDQGYWAGPNYNEANLKHAVDVAADIGAEMILLDAGWYDVEGDWTASPTRFPNGIEPLRQYARSKGLLFGLQTECEGGRRKWPDSLVYHEHPDWFTSQHVLDLARPEVAEYVQDSLKKVIEAYHPDLYRHEFIPEYIEGQGQFTHQLHSTVRFGFIENDYWRYYDHYYDLFRSIRHTYPSLLLQHCANGGTRDDLGNLACFDETYSNEGEPPRVLQSYSGKTLALPPESLVLGFGGQPERGHMETYLRSVFSLGTPWLLSAPAARLEDLTPDVRAEYQHYTHLYKELFRPVMQNCRMYHHAPVTARQGVEDGYWFAVEFAARDRSRGWATIVRLAESNDDHYLRHYSPIIGQVSPGPIGRSDTDVYHFSPRGLDIGRKYQVTFDSSGETVIRDGYELVQQGLKIRLEAVQSSELLLFTSLP